jgi:hypothetical protein
MEKNGILKEFTGILGIGFLGLLPIWTYLMTDE